MLYGKLSLLIQKNKQETEVSFSIKKEFIKDTTKVSFFPERKNGAFLYFEREFSSEEKQ